MGRVHQFLQDMELLELYLHGRLYTWSNEHAHPTLERIDRAFVCVDWCEWFPFHRLYALSSVYSDHAPLLLHMDMVHILHKWFMFESIWLRFWDYLEAVTTGWNYPVHNADTFRTLDVKFWNMARALRSWSQKFMGSIRFQLEVAKDVIYQLDQAQGSCALYFEEQMLHYELKFQCLGLASLNRTIAH
jgi:hypothetical protein